MKDIILANVEGLVSDLLWYDRKEDEELKCGDIEKAIKDGVITVGEIVLRFEKCLQENL